MTKLENAYVAFIDVLGFRHLVASENTIKINKYFEIIKEAFEIIDSDKPFIKKLILSDSIIFVSEQKNENFGLILKAIRSLQAWLAVEDIWVRGAISYGNVCLGELNNGQIIYGDGYIRAFELEKKAIYPRIIIDPRLIALISNDRFAFLKKYSVLCSKRIDEIDESRSPIVSLDSDLITSFSGPKNQNSNDDLFISFGSQMLLKDYSNTRDTHFLDTVYENVKRHIYEDFKYSKKYSWVKKYFSKLLSDAHTYISFSDEIKTELKLINEKFSKL